MKLIVLFSTSDGCTWSYDHVIPVECESAEKLLVDFEAEVIRAAAESEKNRVESDAWSQKLIAFRHGKKNISGADYQDFFEKNHSGAKYDDRVHFFNQEWSLDTFYDIESKSFNNIEILTLDEWFIQNAISA